MVAPMLGATGRAVKARGRAAQDTRRARCARGTRGPMPDLDRTLAAARSAALADHDPEAVVRDTVTLIGILRAAPTEFFFYGADFATTLAVGAALAGLGLAIGLRSVRMAARATGARLAEAAFLVVAV